MFIKLYDIIVAFFSVILDIFFREVKSRGSHKIPKEGPVIFVAAPHANQFVDPLVLMRHCQRQVSFLIAEKSMKRRYIGKGRIYLENSKLDPTLIKGIGTEFTKDLKVGSQIALPDNNSVSEVIKIISDTELIIKKEFKELDAFKLLTNSEGTDFKCLPHVDQSQVYKSVYNTLNDGNCIGIFPEAGVTIMALGAMARNPNLDVKIVPCGLNYFHAHHFRSRAVVEFGSPISITPDLVENFKKGGTDKREACSKLLDIIYKGLKAVTVNTPDYETLMVIQAARRLYRPEHHKLELHEVIELNRRFLSGYMKFKDNDRVKEMNNRVMAYNQLLKYHGLKDHQVNKTVEDGYRVLFLLIYRIIVLTIWIILGLPGFILNLPLIIIARVISAKKAKEAVESSSVKVAGRDVLATWKLLVALVVTPLLYGSYASLRPLFLSLIPSTKSYFQTLREVREQLSYDLTELINELGPKIYPDFDNSRLVREVKGKSRSGSASPSPSRPSSTGLQFSSFLTISDWLSEKNLDWERADDSDYDDVFFFLDQQNGKITGRSRSNSRTRIKDQGSRSRSSSIGSNNDGGLGSNGNTIGIEPLSTVDQSPKIERNHSDLSLPKFTFKDCDEDSGYHGDKEYDDKIETKKEV
nr:13910_t:CDS:2 [Entrophospora candida]